VQKKSSDLKILKIAYDPDFPPLSFMAGSESRGEIIELVRKIVGRIGYEAEFVPHSLSDHAKVIEKKQAHAIAFKAMVPHFKTIYDLSSPLAMTGSAWFATKSKPWPDDPVPGTGRVTTPISGPVFARLEQLFPDLKRVGSDNYAESLAMVVNGEADVAALNFHIASHLAERDYPAVFNLPMKPYEELALAFAVAKGDPLDILDEFNDAPSDVVAEGGSAKMDSAVR